MNRKQLNRTISRAMLACKADASGRAYLALNRLNHARRLLNHGFDIPARLAVLTALCAVRFGV